MPTALSTDLYELTMAAGYFAGGGLGRATFELFVRSLPPRRGFLVAAGLEQALEYLEGLRFTDDQIAYLRQVPALEGAPPDFFDRHLRELRFTGEVWAVAEGTPVFPPAPLLQVRAPIAEAQLVETALLSIITFQTSIASKAARVVAAAQGRAIIEFGARRAHGPEAALYASRAAYIAGCAGTSNVEAGFRFGIPVSGTMAHSWVMAHADELEAFARFSALYGDRAILLLDTYDTVDAVRRVVRSGLRPAAVRLDSGDVMDLSRRVRQVLDGSGLQDTRIFVSGDLDEDRIAALLGAGAPVDGFGVGTALSTSSDAPALGGIYKLVEVERDGVSCPVLKLSPEKRTYPARKQVWRVEEQGLAVRDVIGIYDEAGPAESRPLLRRVMSDGRRLEPPQPLTDLQTRHRDQMGRLPDELKPLTGFASYPVLVTPALEGLAQRVATQYQAPDASARGENASTS